MTRRTEQRAITLEAIRTTARRHMTEGGTAVLSLRAIARDMGMTAPAIYRYYPSRDDLITALILDAFNASADALISADAAQPRSLWGARLRAMMIAYREWALAYPVDFQLIYGNPIPGYHAPREVTTPAAIRTWTAIITPLTEAYAAGVLRPPAHFLILPPTVESWMRDFATQGGYPVPPEVFVVAIHGWTLMHGMVVLEMNGHTPPVVGDSDAFFIHQIDGLIRSINL
jgi:AcrR family transcriptional regulator